MHSSISMNSLTWYLKYIGVPVTIGLTMYKLFQTSRDNKRIAALKGKVVVITGASSGIGEALAHAFYNYGSQLVLASRRMSELNRVKQDLLAKQPLSKPAEPLVLELDLANLEHSEEFIQKVYEKCGHIDILINNGGVSHRGPILHSVMDVFKKIMYINYFGAVALTKAVLPKMVERKSGHIIFVSSVQGLVAIPDRSAYAASKHAMQAFGDSLRSEVHQHNIDVSVVSPGYVKTSVSLNALASSGENHGVMDKTTANGFTPEYVAMKTVDMTVDKQNELIISQFLPRLAIFLRHTSSSLYFWAMAKRATVTK